MTGCACPPKPHARERHSHPRLCTGSNTAAIFRCGTCRTKRQRPSWRQSSSFLYASIERKLDVHFLRPRNREMPPLSAQLRSQFLPSRRFAGCRVLAMNLPLNQSGGNGRLVPMSVVPLSVYAHWTTGGFRDRHLQHERQQLGRKSDARPDGTGPKSRGSIWTWEQEDLAVAIIRRL